MEDNKIGIAGIGIPPEVLFNPELSATEKHLFGMIRLLSMGKNGCYATNAYLGQMLLCGTQNISNGVIKLKDYKYIIVKYKMTKTGTIRNIFINNEYQIIYRPLVEEVHEFLYYGIDIGSDPLKEKLRSAIRKCIGGYKKMHSNNDIYNDSNNDNCIIINNNTKAVLEKTAKSSFDKQKTVQANKPKNSKTTKPKYSRKQSKENNANLKGAKRQSKTARFIEKYIDEIWNSASTTTTHRKDSKVYASIVQKLNQLAEGRFAQCNELNKEWTHININPDLLTQKWTSEDIREALQQTIKYTIDGYWPPDKKNVKNLLSLIYNPRTGTSLMLKAMSDPPEPISCDFDKKTLQLSNNDQIRYLQCVVKKELDPKKAFSMQRLEYTIKSIIDYYPNIKRTRAIRSEANNANLFIEEYVKFLARVWPDVDPIRIGPNTKPFELFIKHMTDDEID